MADIKLPTIYVSLDFILLFEVSLISPRLPQTKANISSKTNAIIFSVSILVWVLIILVYYFHLRNIIR